MVMKMNIFPYGVNIYSLRKFFYCLCWFTQVWSKFYLGGAIMSEKLMMQTTTTPRRRKTRKKSLLAQVILSILAVAVWLGLVYTGYWYIEMRMTENYLQTKKLVEQSIQSVQETNALRVQELEDKLSALNSEMVEIKEALRDADDTLSESNATREQLNRRIEDLDQQLEELRKSLEILKGN